MSSTEAASQQPVSINFNVASVLSGRYGLHSPSWLSTRRTTVALPKPAERDGEFLVLENNGPGWLSASDFEVSQTVTLKSPTRPRGPGRQVDSAATTD